MITRRSFLASLALAPFAAKAGVARAVRPVARDRRIVGPYAIYTHTPAGFGPVVTRTFINTGWVKTGVGPEGNDTGYFAFIPLDGSGHLVYPSCRDES